MKNVDFLLFKLKSLFYPYYVVNYERSQVIIYSLFIRVYNIILTHVTSKIVRFIK